MTESIAVPDESKNGLNRNIDVTVILPSKDEEVTIGACIGKIKTVLENKGITGEIIVADNSEDNTPVIAEKLGATVVIPDKEGYGYAYNFAFEHARGDYIVMGDADDTYDFMELPMLLEPLKKKEADMVIGSRFKGKMEKGAMPRLHRWIGNPVLTWFLDLFFEAGVSDAHCGFRAIRKDTLKKLNLSSEGMEFASEMIMKAVEKGLRIREVPISYYKRKDDNSKLSSFSDGWRHLKFMLLHAPNYLFVYPSALFLVVGTLLLGSGLFNINIGYIPGPHSMVAGSLLTIIGYQVLFFGLFAKIYKGRKLSRFLTLERTATVGAFVFLAGVLYVSYLILGWKEGRFEGWPPIQLDIIGFTLIVLGLQTFFSSFMLSMLANRSRE